VIVRENFLRDILRLIIWYPLRGMLSLLPITSGFGILRSLGDINFVASRGKKRAIMHNLAAGLQNRLEDGHVSEVARNYFRNHFVNQLQIFLFPRFTPGNVGSIHSFAGLENLETELKKGKGCILAHPHFGPTQLPLSVLGTLGYPVMQIGLPTEEGLSFIGRKVAFRLRVKYEKKIPAKIISADSFLRPVLQWVRKNGVVLTTIDGAGGGKHIGKFISIPFLGKPTLFPIGAVSLHLKTGAALLPLFTLERGKGYTTIIHEPVTIRHHGHDEHAVYDGMVQLVRLMEEYVTKYPHLWHFWDELPMRRG
jgi:KDO2-lipid IV(A) lauroyltransferase